MFETTPDVWGPPLWYKMHRATFMYPETRPTDKDKKAMVDFFTTKVYNDLPCEKCRKHYREYLSKYPVEYQVDSQHSLANWLVNMHNEVNTRTGKKIMSYSEVADMYTMTEVPELNLYIIIAVLTVAIIIALQFRP